jgi:hypothetical protein
MSGQCPADPAAARLRAFTLILHGWHFQGFKQGSRAVPEPPTMEQNQQLSQIQVRQLQGHAQKPRKLG